MGDFEDFVQNVIDFLTHEEQNRLYEMEMWIMNGEGMFFWCFDISFESSKKYISKLVPDILIIFSIGILIVPICQIW